MLRQCQHRLAFTKNNWYTFALKAILPKPEKSIQLNFWNARTSSTLATVLKEEEEEDMQLETFVTPSPLASIEPLQTLKPKPEWIRTRCSGFRNYDGQRCERPVKVKSSIPSTEPIFCWKHEPKPRVSVKKNRGSYHSHNHASKEEIDSHIQYYKPPEIEQKIFKAPAKLYNCWDLWIGKHINEKKSLLIRKEMEKPVSKVDKEGFIYCYSFPTGPRASQNTHAYFKIGRTSNPHRRMYQVLNVCKMMPKIYEVFPSFPLDLDQKTLPTNLGTLRKKVGEIPKCPLTHKVESLIHLELSSLFKRANFKCDGCGKTHREWIRIDRKKGPGDKPMTDNQLWISCIRPVILKWIKYGVLASSLSQNNMINNNNSDKK